MEKLLIAHHSEEFINALSMMLSSQFHVTTCTDGKTALELLLNLKPNILILDLMLPHKDGITLLEDAYPCIPPVILATTGHNSDYVRQSAATKGIGYIMMSPCEVRSVVLRLMDLIKCTNTAPNSREDFQTETAEILLKFGIPSERDGFSQLRVGIPLFAQDPAQRLSKELYPAIAEICGYGSGQQVERSIRSAIEAGWNMRKDGIWESYFPASADGEFTCPSNKAFIARIASTLSSNKETSYPK